MKKFVFISHKLQGDPVVYKVKDQASEPTEGIFYKQELLRVDEPEFYTIERIITHKRNKEGKWIYLVKWKNYSDEFNPFVTEEDLKSLKA